MKAKPAQQEMITADMKYGLSEIKLLTKAQTQHLSKLSDAGTKVSASYPEISRF